MKVLSLTICLQAWGSDLEGQWDLITGLPQDWGKQRLQPWRAQQNFACTKTQRKGAVTLQETEPKLPASVGGSPVKMWIGRAHHRDGALAAAVWEGPPWHKSSWRSPLTLHHRDVSPQAKQWTNRECNPTHCQIIGLKLYWARPCQPEQDPVFPPLVPLVRKLI